MINEYENTLRRLIIQIIGGDDSSPYKVSEDRIIKWEEKREIEIKKNNGIIFENRLLYYSDFYDLEKIILKNWDLFLPILNNKKRFEIFFAEVENFRNTIAHGRNLISGQEFLLKGILSDLKNLITLYHNKNEMKEDFFVEIIKITDNLGNIWDRQLKTPNPILRVGDEYELIIEANDPKERRIEYEIFTMSGTLKITQDFNRFNFIIENKLVSRLVSLYIVVRTPDSEYKNDALEVISLTILPK